MEARHVTLTVRAGAGDTLLLRASNDEIVDSYGTVITSEALLRDWWAGYQQHRTVSLQHNLPELRGITGQPNVGRASRVDFTPQLEVEVQVLDPAVLELVRSGRITSASLEFVPTQTEVRTYAGRDQVEVYHRLSSEPEHTGLSLVDVPGVPGAEVLSVRSLPALWAYAVVDPLVLNGEVTDPAQVRELAWFPHHDERSHAVEEQLLQRAIADLEAGRIVIPPTASLTAAQVAQRARAHLARHTNLGLARAQAQQPRGGRMNEWIRARAAQYQAEGLSKAEATQKAQADYDALTPELRARLEGDDGQETRGVGIIERLFGRGNRGEVHVHVTEPAVQIRNEAPAAAPAATPPAAAAAAAATDDGEGGEGDEGQPAELTDEVIDQRIQARIDALSRLPEHPMAAIAAGLQIRSTRMEPEQVLAEVMARTVLKQIQRQEVTTKDRQEVDNILARHGIVNTPSRRALTIEGNGVVIYEELARQFVIRPSADVFFRNHMRSLPMAGTKKADFPRFDRTGLSFQWNRQNTPSTGSLTEIDESDPTLDTFPIEVTELNGATRIADSFLHFNTSGATFVAESLLPEFRGAGQAAEDLAFWLSTGTHPDPATFRGLRHVLGVTDANPGPVAVQFTENVLNRMLRAMPAAYRKNTSQLAYYLPLAIGDDFAEIRAARATALGDRYAETQPTLPGPVSIGRYRGIEVFGVPQLPTDEVVGGDTDCSTAYLVFRPVIAIGDGLTVRIEPHRVPNFQTLIQLQEFVGLGYEWPEAVVRFSGLRPKAST